MILRNESALDELKSLNERNDGLLKFCIDIEREVVSACMDYHIDMEYELLDDGSEEKNIFGGNIYLDDLRIVWEAHPNIARNRENGYGAGRLLTDENTINALKEILFKRIK